MDKKEEKTTDTTATDKLMKQVFVGDSQKEIHQRVEFVKEFISAGQSNPDLTLGEFFQLHGIDPTTFFSSKLGGIFQSLKPETTPEEAADLLHNFEKHLYHQRISLLQMKFEVLNDYMLSTEPTFGQYLEDIKMPQEEFLKGIPKKYKNENIFSENHAELHQFMDNLFSLYMNEFANFVDTAPSNISSSEIMKAFSAPPIQSAHSADGSDEYFNLFGKVGKWFKRVTNPHGIERAAKHVVQEGIKVGQRWTNTNGLKRDVKAVGKALKKISLDGILHGANIILLAPLRGIILLCIDINLFGMATDFSKEADANSTPWQKIGKMWEILGGKANKLTETVNNGKNKRKFGADGDNTYFNATKSEETAAVGAAGSAISAIPGVLPAGAPYIAGATSALGGMIQLLPDSAPSKSSSPLGSVPTNIPGADAQTQAALDTLSGKGVTGFIKSHKAVMFIVGGVILAGLSALLFIKKKK